MITVLWSCPDCAPPVHLTVPVTPTTDGARVHVGPAVRVHLRQHAR